MHDDLKQACFRQITLSFIFFLLITYPPWFGLWTLDFRTNKMISPSALNETEPSKIPKQVSEFQLFFYSSFITSNSEPNCLRKNMSQTKKNYIESRITYQRLLELYSSLQREKTNMCKQR
jgi:hypothetical protein